MGEEEPTIEGMIADYRNLINAYKNIQQGYQKNFTSNFVEFREIFEFPKVVGNEWNNLVASIQEATEACFMNAELVANTVKTVMLDCAEHSFRDVTQGSSTYADSIRSLQMFMNQKLVFSTKPQNSTDIFEMKFKNRIKEFSELVHNKGIRAYTTNPNYTDARRQVKDIINDVESLIKSSASGTTGYIMSQTMEDKSQDEIVEYIKSYIEAIRDLSNRVQYQVRRDGSKSEGFFATISEHVYDSAVELLYFLMNDILSNGSGELLSPTEIMKSLIKNDNQINVLLNDLTNSFKEIQIKSSQRGEDWLKNVSSTLPLYIMSLPIKINDQREFDSFKNIVNSWYKDLNKIGTGQTEIVSAAARDNIINFLRVVAGQTDASAGYDSSTLVDGYSKIVDVIEKVLNLPLPEIDNALKKDFIGIGNRIRSLL